MSTKVILGIVAVILVIVAVVGFFFRDMIPGLGGAANEPVATTTPATPVWATYATTTYSIDYPPGYELNTSYQYTGFPNKPISGVAFVVPQTLATGTNLSADTRISVEQLPRANTCSGDIFMVANVKASTVTENGVTYSVATSSDAATGNRYDEMVYAVAGSKPCTAVRYFIHTTELANYPAGTVREYDRQSLLTEFDEIRRSLKIGGTTPEATSTPVTP